MRPTSLECLSCPVCNEPFYFDEFGTGVATAGTLRCDRGHAFDFAKQGYVNLVPGGKLVHTADDDQMVTARARFHANGHYAGLAERIAEIVGEGLWREAGSEVGSEAPAAAQSAPDTRERYIADVGAGTGYYAAAIAERAEAEHPEIGTTVLALDISKYALRRAAKVHPNVVALGADTWDHIPVSDNALDAVVCVFAPRNAAEFARVLRADGRLVIVRPTPEHMAEVRDAAGLIKIGGNKEADLEYKLSPFFAEIGRERYTRELTLSHRDIEDLVMMGPNRHHTTLNELRAAIAVLPEPATSTLAVEITVYELKKGAHRAR